MLDWKQCAAVEQTPGKVGGAWLFASWIRARLLGSEDALLTALVDVMLTVVTLVVVGEGLGTVDEFRRVAIVSVMAALGLAGALVPGRPGFRLPSAALTRPRWSVPTVIAALTVALVAAQWLSSLDTSVRVGINFIDALDYHLTWAAHFATSHSTRSYIHTFTGDQTPYYPFNDELLHGIGMALFPKNRISM